MLMDLVFVLKWVKSVITDELFIYSISLIQPNHFQDQKRWEDEQREIARQKQLMQLQEEERSAILEVSINLFMRAKCFCFCSVNCLAFRALPIFKILLRKHPYSSSVVLLQFM